MLRATGLGVTAVLGEAVPRILPCARLPFVSCDVLCSFLRISHHAGLGFFALGLRNVCNSPHAARVATFLFVLSRALCLGLRLLRLWLFLIG